MHPYGTLDPVEHAIDLFAIVALIAIPVMLGAAVVLTILLARGGQR